MKFSTADLRTDRQWRAATGLDQKRFTKLLALLPAAYQQLYGQGIQQRQQQCPDEPMLDSYEDLLLFTLFSRSGAPVKIRTYLRSIGAHDWYGWLHS